MVNYVCKYSDELSIEEIKDFVNCFNEVFNLNYDEKWFLWKYIDNIYGKSIIVIAYKNNKVIGIRAFWRNDFQERLSYQPVDTGILKSERKNGLFLKMTELALDKTKEINTLIYNFPNKYSLNGYLKLGWRHTKKINLKLFSSYFFSKGYIHKISDSKYINWRFKNNPIKYYYSYKKREKYYLVSMKSKYIYIIVCEISKQEALMFKNISGFKILFMYSLEKNFFKVFNNKSNLVIKGLDEIEVPIFKGDVI